MIKQIPFSKAAFDVIKASFKSIADEMYMTAENCPGNSAFMSYDKFQRAKQMVLFGLFDQDLIGCIGVEYKSEVRYKIKYVSVLPTQQHKGYGRKLVEHACHYIEEAGGKKIQLGMIRENEILFDWYLSLGFELDKVVNYRKNAFTVAYMEKIL